MLLYTSFKDGLFLISLIKEYSKFTDIELTSISKFLEDKDICENIVNHSLSNISSAGDIVYEYSISVSECDLLVFFNILNDYLFQFYSKDYYIESSIDIINKLNRGGYVQDNNYYDNFNYYNDTDVVGDVENGEIPF